MLKIHDIVEKIKTGKNTTFADICAQFPKSSNGGGGGGSSSSGLPLPYPGICSIFNNIKVPTACAESSLLEVWGSGGSYANTKTALDSLNNEQILQKINEERVTSGIFGKPVQVRRVVGGIKEDGQGKVISASALSMSFQTALNLSDKENSVEKSKGKTKDLTIKLKAFGFGAVYQI